MRPLAIALFLCAIGTAQTPKYPCQPSPDVAAAIRNIQDFRDNAVSGDYVAEARKLLGEVLRKHPDDIFAHLQYLSFHPEKGRDDVIAGYRSLLDAHPSDPRYELYYAASLIGSNTGEALRRLTSLSSVPDFPYPALLIGQIHSYEKFRDLAALTSNLTNFVSACPDYLPAYERLSFFGRGNGLTPVAERLRKALSGRTDREVLVAYRWLWQLEFRTAAASQFAAIRKRISEDLAVLRRVYPADDPSAIRTFREGYRVTGDTAGMNSLPSAPPKREDVYEAESEWYRNHPRGKDDTQEQTQRYFRELAQSAQSWIVRWPDEPAPYLRRFTALAELPETTEADLVHAGEQLVAVTRKRPGRFVREPAVITVARAYVDRSFRLDQVPRMIEIGLQEAETVRPVPEYDFGGDRNWLLNEGFRFESRIAARDVEFDWLLKTSDLPRAQKALGDMRNDIDQLLAVTTHVPDAQYLDSEYWMKMARLAELEGRDAEVGKYRRLAEERRNSPVSRSSGPSSASLVGTRLPPFRANGIDGHIWSTADLDGKIGVINIWATWCGPCIEELPLLQKLHDQLHGKPEVLVLTLNADANPGVVAPFVKARGFTFPVLLASDYVEQLLPNMGIPRNWIVELGVIRSEHIGQPEPDRWLAEILAKAEEAQRAK